MYVSRIINFAPQNLIQLRFISITYCLNEKTNIWCVLPTYSLQIQEYSMQLETLVQERTDALKAEQSHTDEILHSM